MTPTERAQAGLQLVFWGGMRGIAARNAGQGLDGVSLRQQMRQVELNKPEHALGGVGFDTSNLESKLNGYLLNSAHPQNQTKANWFKQALGFDQSNWQELAKQLYFDPATAVLTKTTQHGKTYEQVISVTGINGKTIDVMFVFMKDNSGIVRLVTGIPARK